MKLPNPAFWKDKKVVLTGADGFKGKWLHSWLTELGAIVFPSGATDIRDKEKMERFIAGIHPDIAIHMAAISTVQEAFENPIDALDINAVGTITFLEAVKSCRNTRAILNVTTDKVYHVDGINRGYTELDNLGGLEAYAVSKVCSEHISTMYQRTYKLPLATARAGNVIGGGDVKVTRIIPNYYNAWKSGNVLDVNIDAIRPWQYVLDCLCGYLLLCEKLYDNVSYAGSWNFASNEYESRTVQWLVDEMNKYFTPPVQYRLIDDRGYYETKHLKLCSDKAHKALQWEPRYDMAETIRRTANWYLNREQSKAQKTDHHLYLAEIREYMEGQR
jgi:CDP-glucose 4,6-dehydratase